MVTIYFTVALVLHCVLSYSSSCQLSRCNIVMFLILLHHREDLIKTGAQLVMRRKQLISELAFIYPIVEVSIFIKLLDDRKMYRIYVDVIFFYLIYNTKSYIIWNPSFHASNYKLNPFLR